MAPQYPPVTLPNSEVRRLSSAFVNDTFCLHVSVPVTYANSERSYPVVYLTDGNGLFPLVQCIVEGLSTGLEIPRSIVVGIGYESNRPMERERYRERDLLPTNASARSATRRQEFTRSGLRRGQAGTFLRFIREELQPFINANYRTDRHDSTYAGTSYGGLFGLYVLFHQPDTFNRYVIGSPALHHDDRVTMAYERDYAATHDDLPARIFMSVGAREEVDDPLIESSFQFVSNVKLLAQKLQDRNYPRLQLITHVFKDETHGSVVPATFSRGLRTVFK